MFSKIEVNGDNACELYQMLTSALPNEEGKNEITWNFTKFLVDAEGKVIARYSPMVTPEDIGDALQAL